MDLQMVGVVIAIIVHIIATAWWASKITTLVTMMSESLNKIDKELEKRDQQIAKLWERIDGIRDMIK